MQLTKIEISKYKSIVQPIIINFNDNLPLVFIGKNGSGKTTIIKMINDLLTIDSGEIVINGEHVGNKSKALISYLPEKSYLDNSKTVAQIFKFFQDFYSDFDLEKAKSLLKDLDL